MHCPSSAGRSRSVASSSPSLSTNHSRAFSSTCLSHSSCLSRNNHRTLYISDLPNAAPESPVAAVLTKSPEILAMFCIPVAIAGLPKRIYAVFDSHSRPDTHPEGSAFIFFPTAHLAAEYLAGLLGVDEAIMKAPDLQWQTEMLMTYSTHNFVAPRSEEGKAVLNTTSDKSMLYESTALLLKERAKIASLERQIAELKKETATLHATPALQNQAQRSKGHEGHARHQRLFVPTMDSETAKGRVSNPTVTPAERHTTSPSIKHSTRPNVSGETLTWKNLVSFC